MRIRLLVAATVMLILMACGGSAGESERSTSGTGGESTITTPQPTTTTPSPEAESGPLVGIGEVEEVESSLQLFETEGPQWMPDDGVLLFSDVAGNTIYQVAADDEITVFRMPSDYSNGLAVDPQGRLIAAESDTRRVTRTERNGTVTAIAERFEGARLNQPNDIAVRSDGTIYFTDPVFGDAAALVELDFRGVFRIAPNGSLTLERRGDTSEAPNGVALSPDERQLYVTDYFANLVRVFDIDTDGSLSKARKLVTVSGPDGMAVDQAGNLFVASYNGGGIEVFAPDGEHWGTIEVPGSPTNCAFGGTDGRTLYVTAGAGLYRVTLAHPGIY
jgi:gluconolactonase